MCLRCLALCSHTTHPCVPVHDLPQTMHRPFHCAPNSLLKITRSLPESAYFFDHFAFATYFISAGCCFFASTLFHTHFSHSRGAFIRFGCLDYAGISTLICGSCCLVTYFSYYCDDTARTLWICATLMVASVGIIGPFLEKWSHRSFRPYRVLIYLASGIVSAAPILIYIGRNGFPELEEGSYWTWFWVGNRSPVGSTLLMNVSFLDGLSILGRCQYLHTSSSREVNIWGE